MKKPSVLAGVAIAVVVAVLAAVGVTLGVSSGPGSTSHRSVAAATLDASVTPAATAAFGTPAMDATDDAIWNTTPAISISGSPISATDRILWDSKYVYVLVTVQDSTPVYGQPNPNGGPYPGYQQGLYNDSVDFWINWVDNPGATYGSTDATAIDITRGGAVAQNADSPAPGSDPSVVLSKVVSTSTSYTVEAAFPWPGSVRPGSPIGFNTSINDIQTDGGSRADYITWDTVDSYWTSPAGMPTVGFTGGDNNGQIFGNDDAINLPLGQTYYLPTWPDLASAGSVTYADSDSTVAYLDGSAGSVTGLKLGTTTITATASGYPDESITVNVIIPPGLTGFTTPNFTVPGTPLTAGATVDFSVANFWGTTTPTGFTKVVGSSWLSLSSAGVVTGTVPTPVPSQPGAIEVTGTDGTTTSTISVIFPVATSDGGHFLIPDLTTSAVQSGGAVTQSVAGLWSGPSAASFSKVSGASWLSVSASGIVTGTPPKGTHTTGVITVQGNDGTAAGDIQVEVPVLAPGQRPTITAASWNLAGDGTNFTGALAKEVTAITSSDLDVIGLQETNGTGATQLADALGWYSYQSSGDLGIVSAYPISDVTAPATATPAAGVTVDVDGENLRVWDAHLSDADYGPTRAAAGDTNLAAYELTTTRYAQAQAIAKEIAPDLAKAGSTPVLLLGDLASPSGLDWTAATSAEHDNAGAVNWPVPALFAKAGLIDSFRKVNPNPVTDPGNTYSLTATGGAADRIDYVDYRGPLQVLGAEAYYTGSPSATNSAADQWPSDHAAAVTVFRLQPAAAFQF